MCGLATGVYGLELMIFLPTQDKCWDYRHVPHFLGLLYLILIASIMSSAQKICGFSYKVPPYYGGDQIQGLWSLLVRQDLYH